MPKPPSPSVRAMTSTSSHEPVSGLPRSEADCEKKEIQLWNGLWQSANAQSVQARTVWQPARPAKGHIEFRKRSQAHAGSPDHSERRRQDKTCVDPEGGIAADEGKSPQR